MNAPTPSLDRHTLISSLIRQVSKAVPEGQSERAVTTIITRKMWDAWCWAVGIPHGSKPTEWLGLHDTHRVYGSETIVLEDCGEAMISVSFATPRSQLP